jgi:probable addiction module antidote protein
MTSIRTSPFDPAGYLRSEEDILFYLEAAMEDSDPSYIARAFGDVVRSQVGSKIVSEAGFQPQALYNALSENGNPTLETLTSVLSALGLQLTVQKRAA